MTGPRPGYLVALAAGVALSFAFPEGDLAPVAWLALVPLIVVCRTAGAGRGFILGFAFGIGFFGALLIWISLVGWVAWALLVALEALFVGLFGAAWAVVSRWHLRGVALLGPAVLWVALEHLRASIPFGGFPWGELAQSQHNLAWMLKPAAWGGGRAVAFAIVLVNALVAAGWWRWRLGEGRSAWAVPLASAALVLALPVALPSASREGDAVRVAIVQGNVPRDFPGSTLDKELAIIASHRDLTADLEGAAPDLVVWPESSVGIDPTRNPEAAAAIGDAARAAGAPMIVGGNLDVDADHYQVVTLHISPEGTIIDRYRKTHLVPFGEYVPGRKLIGWIPLLDQVPRDAVAGDEAAVFDVAGGEVATVISFEGDFGSLVRGRIAAGGRLLVVATNTSTWGYSWASAQHVAMSQVRAAENRVWVVHAALSGISAVIEPGGRVIARTPLWEATTLVHDVAFVERVSFYARTGDWLPLGCWVAAPVLLAGGLRRARRDARGPA